MSEVMKAVQLHVSHLQTSPFPVDVYMQMNPHSSASYSSSSWPFYIKLQTRKQVNRRKVLLENFLLITCSQSKTNWIAVLASIKCLFLLKLLNHLFWVEAIIEKWKERKSESWSSSWGVNGKLWLNVVFYLFQWQPVRDILIDLPCTLADHKGNYKAVNNSNQLINQSRERERVWDQQSIIQSSHFNSILLLFF